MDAKPAVGQKKPGKVWTVCPECQTALDKKEGCVLCPNAAGDCALSIFETCLLREIGMKEERHR